VRPVRADIRDEKIPRAAAGETPLDMAIPDREIIKAGLVHYIAEHGGRERSLRPTEIYDGLAEYFALTPEDRALQRTAETLWENEVRWARRALVDEGYILTLAQAQWGVWKLADSVKSYIPSALPRTRSQNQGLQDPRLQLEFPKINEDLSDEGVFSPASLSDARDIAIRAIVQRRGQHNFRAKLLSAYNFRCCVTEENSIQVLEAAHIVPYNGEATNHVQNGLLLRSDIHTLFDLELLSINPDDYTVVISPNLKSSSYANFAGERIQVPEAEEQRPSKEALKIHRESCGF
jgi:hypothetical protein